MDSNNEICNKHFSLINEMINNYGIDYVNNHLSEELIRISKKVAKLRDEIYSIENILKSITNSDEIMHLQYDMSQANNNLNSIITQLKLADERYKCFRIIVDRI